MAVFLLLPALPVQAADINVDANCTIAQAITSANDNSAPSGSTCEDGEASETTSDNIILSADVTLSAALPAISSNITINGRNCRTQTSSADCVINGNGAYRIFEVEAGAGTGGLSIQHLTLTNGGPSAGGGGAIRIKGSSVTVSDSAISNSVAGATHASGGAILVTSEALSLTVQSSTISGNSSSNQGGGGISIAGGVNSVNNNSARIVIADSIISGNSANTEGGGIYVGGGADNVEISDTEISGNDAANGAGVYVDGTGSEVEISGTSIEDNEATNNGGGMVLAASSTAEIEESAFKDNSSGANGGGIYTAGTLTLQNSTLSGNAASESQGSGGGIYIGGGTATIQHVTIAGSSAGSGGQALHHNSGTLNLYNSLLAGDGTLCAGDGTISGNEGNLIQDNTCSPAVSGDPLLAPIAGFPAALPLLENSPALDAAAEDHCLSQDQRGTSRTATACDIGAYEGVVQGLGGISGIVEPVVERETGRGGQGESQSSGADSDDAEPSPAVQICSGELLHATSDIRVSVTNGLCSGAQFKQVESDAGIGDDAVIASGWLDAVDVYGWVEQGVSVCFAQVGAAAFLDAATAPRMLYWLESYSNGAGMTCVTIDRPGTVVLVPGSPTLDNDPTTQLTDCMVYTKSVLHFRDAPDGESTGLLPASVTLTALSYTPGWYQVDYYGARGWISADYVTPQGSCG